MSLQSWLQNSWLVQHTSSADEIKNLLAISDRDLAACQVKQLPADWRCAIAYNAALQAATAALAAAGSTRDPVLVWANGGIAFKRAAVMRRQTQR
jgi:hypothetical protein